MTTTPDHHDPRHDGKLSDEERDLAARLGRIGPFDGPSPALDAKIIAAAHAAAVARAPSRRRLAWLGVPPALVTGMGVAAAAVLALGLVWQLRPRPGIAVQGEADAGEEVILIAEPAGGVHGPAITNPPPLAENAPAAAAPQPAMKPAMPAQASHDSAKAVAASPPAAMAEQAASLAAQADAAAEEKREADAYARDAAAESGFVAEPSPASAVSQRSHATYTTAARARAEQHARAAKANAAAAPTAAAPVAAAAPASAAASAEAETLDRIEVTGSRIGRTDWSQVPVSDDTRLAAAEWLERIRARRDGDDTENARASLRLFQRDHPRVHLPDDLRELLAEATR